MERESRGSSDAMRCDVRSWGPIARGERGSHSLEVVVVVLLIVVVVVGKRQHGKERARIILRYIGRTR